MKGRIAGLLAVLLLCLVSCSSKKEAATATSEGTKEMTSVVESNGNNQENYGTKESMTPETTQNIAESGNEYQAILCVDEKMNSEIMLKKGRMISVLSKDGYQFEGYYTAWDENYVAKDGMVIKEYNGTDVLKLYPKFSPLEYELRFYQNGEEVAILKRSCNYEMNLMDFLPIGGVLGEECIIGFQDDNRKLIIGGGMEELYLKDAQNILDSETRQLRLNLITTPIYYEYERLDSYRINDSGFFEQELDEKGFNYELCSLEKIDMAALKSFGYQNVEIAVTCWIREEHSGNQHIRIYANETNNKKEEYLMDSGTIENIEKGEEEKFTMKAVVPIEKLESQKIYIYYNASGMGKDDWISPKMQIAFTFIKE